MRLLPGLSVLAFGLLAVAPPVRPAQVEVPASPPRPVRAVLADAGVAIDGLPADLLDTPAIDFAVEKGSATLALACRLEPQPGRRRLDVRVLDPAGHWRAASFDAAEFTRGAVSQVRDLGDWVVVTTDRGDMLGDVLVLDRALQVRARLDGSLVDVLPDGGLLFRENQEGARPARPLALSIYAPRGQAHSRIYPPDLPQAVPRQHYAERTRRAFAGWGLERCLAVKHPCNADLFDAFVVSDVRADARGQRFAWVTRFGPPEGETAGPIDFRAYVVVACDRVDDVTGAVCRERPFGQFDGPDGANTQGALAMALTRRGERR